MKQQIKQNQNVKKKKILILWKKKHLKKCLK